MSVEFDFPIPPEIRDFRPEGNRLLVRTLDPEKSFGAIEIPDSVYQKPGAGIVVMVGPLVGTMNPNIGAADLIYQGQDLIGKVVTFSDHVGMSCKIHSWEGQYGGDWLLMMARDIMGYNLGPQPSAGDNSAGSAGSSLDKE